MMETTLFMIRHAESPFKFGQERTRALSTQGETDANKITELMSQENMGLKHLEN